MSGFDELIEETDRYVERMRAAGRQVRELHSPAQLGDRSLTAGPAVSSLPLRVGPGAGPGLVMKSETFVELGSPTAGSCSFVLSTERPASVHGGRITLIGPDVPESQAGATVPFGQVIVAGGGALTEAHHPLLVESQYVGDKIEGFMVKTMPGRVWARVSTEAVQRGFDFAFLGAALMELVTAQIPEVEAMEVLFVTSGKADIDLLGEIASQAGKLGRAIKARLWKDRGIDIDDCAFGGHCGSCPDHAICDEVRKIAHTRRVLQS